MLSTILSLLNDGRFVSAIALACRSESGGNIDQVALRCRGRVGRIGIQAVARIAGDGNLAGGAGTGLGDGQIALNRCDLLVECFLGLDTLCFD